MSEIRFWVNKEEKTVEPTLFSSQAEELARKIAKDNEERKSENKRTQLRKFYDEVTRLDVMAKGLDMGREADKKRWSDILPLVHMLTAKAAYAKGRRLISKRFLKFIKSSVEKVEAPGDLSVFAGFFEAFMGFYRLHGPSS